MGNVQRNIPVIEALANIFRLFAKLRKATISFVTSFRKENFGSHWTDLHEYYSKICRENVLNSDDVTGALHEDLTTFMI